MMKIIKIESCRYCPCNKEGFVRDGNKYCRASTFVGYFGDPPQIKVEPRQLIIKNEDAFLDICPLEDYEK